MFFFMLRPSINIFFRRLFSQTSILPYEIDRFNAARVRKSDWSDDIKSIRETLSG